MEFSLTPCPACRRHVRVSDDACPFCAASLEPAASQPRLPGAAQLGRAAAIAALSSVALAGCERQAAAIYGGPPAPSGSASPAASAPAGGAGQGSR